MQCLFPKKILPAWSVLNTKDDCYDWPGDEWGDKATAEYLFDGTLTASLDAAPKYLCEFGAGAGRYTYWPLNGLLIRLFYLLMYLQN